ncbi:MAG: hypothetical protein A2X59_12095 [Nitrospirae bacterium GWC2_42_7]|nr:MAG: hypothetical protein A2X59_12095 [Nitrospirae bacterium GWC2_42_7]
MECREVQDNLNNYIEGMLPSEALKSFEEHIATCTICSESLADLRKSIELVKGLEEIEPPQWLTQKVMAKVREEDVQQKKGIFKRLSSLFKLNMPLKAVAAVAIAVTTIYIFKEIQPVVHPVKPALEETVEEMPLKEQKRSRVPKKEKMAQEPAFGGKVEKKDSALPYADSPMPAAGYGSTDKFYEAQKAPSPAYEQEKSSSFAGAPSPAKDNFRMEDKTSAASRGMEEKIIDDMIFTVIVKDIESARKEVWQALSLSGGKVTRTETYTNKYLLYTEIDPAKLKELKDKLKNIGEVKQVGIDSSRTQGNVAVRIEITGM